MQRGPFLQVLQLGVYVCTVICAAGLQYISNSTIFVFPRNVARPIRSHSGYSHSYHLQAACVLSVYSLKMISGSNEIQPFKSTTRNWAFSFMPCSGSRYMISESVLKNDVNLRCNAVVPSLSWAFAFVQPLINGPTILSSSRTTPGATRSITYVQAFVSFRSTL